MLLSSLIHSTSSVDLEKNFTYENKPCFSCQIATPSSWFCFFNLFPPLFFISTKNFIEGQNINTEDENTTSFEEITTEYSKMKSKKESQCKLPKMHHKSNNKCRKMF